jgi:poly(A) polymerase
MEISARIEKQEWMDAPATRAVMRALTAEGARALFVGGCVRNTLLGRKVDDIDIATETAPPETVRLLQAAGIKAVATGIEHGTVTAVAQGKPFEVTTLRRDAETFGRKARVEFTDDWLEDAKRRDFTFNALYCDVDGALYDPFDGRADLEKGRVRFVGSAAARIAEDYLRVFRYFRFLAWYGKPPPDEGAIDAIGAAAPLLTGLSGERVQKEMLKLLAASDPAAVVALMYEEGVLEHWLPETSGTGRLVSLLALEKSTGLAGDPLRRLMALLDDDADIDAMASRWRLSRAMQTRLALGLAHEPKLVSLDAKSMRALVYRIGNQAATDRLALHVIRSRIGAKHPALTGALPVVRDWRAPKFPLTGADVLALGIQPGADVGLLLAAVEDWWVAGDFAADAEACRAELKRVAGQKR